MAVYQFRLGDKDREQYGGDEWVVFDRAKLDDLTYDELFNLERDMIAEDNLSLAVLRLQEWPRLTALAFRAMCWLARQTSGVAEPKWAAFRPNTEAMRFRVGGGGVNPPDQSSSEPPPAAKRSRRR